MALRPPVAGLEILNGIADDAKLRSIVAEGWQRAQGGLVAIVCFGATLLAVQEWLERDTSPGGSRKLHDPRGGTGLKAWLAKECPEVNYKTAYGYMSAADGLRREARLAEGTPLLSLMGVEPVPEARAEKLRLRVQRIIARSSLALLKEAASSVPSSLPMGGAREGAGRKAAPPDSMTAAGVAWGKIGATIDRAQIWKFAKFLPLSMAQEALATTTDLQAALKARIAELKEGA